MAKPAVARETLFALRREIARIEGVLPERLDVPAETQPGMGETVLRQNGVAATILATGVPTLDSALGGGLPRDALIEIHAAQTRDAGTAAGFALGLCSLTLKAAPRERGTLLWIGTGEIFREAGFPYAAGLLPLFGIEPQALILSETAKLADALWVAEEASRLKALAAVIVELRGNPDKLDLTATRRLHRRAADAGRPVFLVRQGAQAEPTAAPVRLVVAPAPAAPRRTVAGPLKGSIGPPSFSVSVDKSRTALPGQFILEWNPDERSFTQRQPENPGAMVPLSQRRADHAAAAGPILAFDPGGPKAASGHQPPREERAAHRRSG